MALDRPRLWRSTAALSALLLSGLVLVCAQGSLTIIAHKPATDREGPAAGPSWEYWCTRGTPRQERKRLAFCARVEGRVLASTHGPNPDEAHIAMSQQHGLAGVQPSHCALQIRSRAGEEGAVPRSRLGT